MTNQPNVLPCLCGTVPNLVDLAGWEILCPCGISFCLHENPTLEATVSGWNKLHTRAIDRDEVVRLVDIVAKAAYTEGRSSDDLHGFKPSFTAEAVIKEAKAALLAYIGIKE